MGKPLSWFTSRLVLRPTGEEDAEFILELLNTPKWLKFVGDRQVHSKNEAKAYIKKRMLPQLERLGYSNYTIIRKSDGNKLGCCGIYDREGLEGVDIGFALLPEYERCGYAFEASREIMRAAKEEFGISKISGITAKDHLASQKLLLKLGLNLSGTVVLPDEEEELLVYQKDL
ncbi:MAG: GNAT family N-acetyltransferase [Flavobacteriaceae bacterium]